jgi:hypothetical protein
MEAFTITLYGPQLAAEVMEAATDGRIQVAEAIAAQARADAPVKTGEYRDGIGIQVQGDDVRVVDEDEDAGYKEYGTHNTPAHAVLTDTARQYGRYTGVQPRG